MMSGMSLEICWAFNERWINKFYYKFASCWLFLLSRWYPWSFVTSKVTSGPNINISQNLHHFLDRMLPYSNTCCNFRDSCDSIRLISLSNFSLLLSASVRGRPLRGRSAKSVFLSLQCLTHDLIVLAQTHASPYIHTLELCVDMPWRNSVLKKKFCHCTLHKLLVIANNILALKYDHVTRVGDMILNWN